VRFDAATLIEPLRIDDAARRNCDIVGAYALQYRFRIRSLDVDLAERAHVKEADPGAHRHMLGRDQRMPTRAAPGVVSRRRRATLYLGLRQEPMGPLPAGHLAEMGAARCQLLVHWSVAHAPCSGELPERKMIRIEQAKRLRNAGDDEGARRL